MTAPTDTMSDALAEAAANVGPDEVAAAIISADEFFREFPEKTKSLLVATGIEMGQASMLSYADIFALLVAAKSAQTEVV